VEPHLLETPEVLEQHLALELLEQLVLNLLLDLVLPLLVTSLLLDMDMVSL
jgi:hypothetical protein